jgi:hypothetical protein
MQNWSFYNHLRALPDPPARRNWLSKNIFRHLPDRRRKPGMKKMHGSCLGLRSCEQDPEIQHPNMQYRTVWNWKLAPNGHNLPLARRHQRTGTRQTFMDLFW